MTIVQVTGEEILNSIPSEELLKLAIVKMFMEGEDWRAVAHEFPRICFEISIAMREREGK